MRKLILLFISLLVLSIIFIGCGGNESTSGKSKPTQAATEPASNSESVKAGSTVSLKIIKQAAIDAGYIVTDDYQASFLKDVLSGFSVNIIADNQDVIYSILECKNEDAAMQNAKTIDDAGYNITIRNGNFITCYGVEDKEGTAKDILASILEGKPLQNK